MLYSISDAHSMNWLTYHVASGEAFFSGLALVVVAAILGLLTNRSLKFISTLVCIIGVIAIAISSTPLAIWHYVIAGAILLFWLISLRTSGRIHKHHRLATVLIIVACIVFAALEFPHHWSPRLPQVGTNTIVIFGDSVAAGIDGHDTDTWPQLLSKSKPVSIHDYSQMGATISDALKTAEQVSIPDGLILLEIGGNDLLGSVSVETFERDLDALLAHVSGERRHVIMFELPLPPFYNSFGRVQRSLADKYNVTLLPKRLFMRVVASENTTLDSIHLSPRGHEAMANCVWKIVGPALSEDAV